MRFCAHSSQWKMWRSVPQTEAVSTAMRTSVGPICGTGTSRISMPGAAVGFTRACMVRGRVVLMADLLRRRREAGDENLGRKHFIVARSGEATLRGRGGSAVVDSYQVCERSGGSRNGSTEMRS